MEGETPSWRKKKRKKKRREAGSSTAPPPVRHPHSTFFPLMLASCADMGRPGAAQFIKHLLRTHLAFLRGRGESAHLDQILPPGVLSLVPLLLQQTNKVVIAVLAAEMVGAVALCSLDANEVIASDGGTVRALVTAVGSPSRRVATAACNAVLDLSVAPCGRERLRESLAIEKLLS